MKFTDSRNTRFAHMNNICPVFTRKTEGERTLSITTTQLWNEVGVNLTKKVIVHAFKNNNVNLLLEKQRSFIIFNMLFSFLFIYLY